MSKHHEQKPYKLAQFVKAAGKKYIQFYIWNEDKQKLERIRDYRINKYYGTPEFKNARERIIREINTVLVNGGYKSLLPRAEKSKRKTLTVRDAFDHILKIKQASLRSRSYTDYLAAKNMFFTFFEQTQAEVLSLPVDQLRNEHFIEYFQWLQLERKLKPKSVNNQKTYMRALLNNLVDEEYLEKNPFTKFKLLPVDEVTTHNIFTDEQARTIKDYLRQHNLQLLDLFEFIFYSFVRPNEARQLKAKWMNLRTNVGHVPANISKTRRARNFEITSPMREVLLRTGIETANPEDYIFSKSGMCGPKKYGRHHFSLAFRDCLTALGMDNGYTLYSTKHYGVTKHHLAGYDWRWLQDQAGFAKLETLSQYLRSLSLKITRSTDLVPPSI
jgi:integrase